MADITLRYNLAESELLPHNIALRGVVDAGETEAATIPIYWRWDDEPDMEPQLLGNVKPGGTLSVPFDMKGRDIRLIKNERSSVGRQAFRNLRNADYIVFSQTTVAQLQDAVFGSGVNTLTIANNGGTGDIHILRKIDSADYAEIGTNAFDDPSFVDTPDINGAYSYKLVQDGLEGESNVLSTTVTGIGSPAGTPPTALTAIWDGTDTTTISWTNHSGTGSNIVERSSSLNHSLWVVISTVSSGSTSTTDTVIPSPGGSRTYYYRVRNESVAGYSNEDSIFVPRET